MPIYEFECLACGERFERLQKMADPDPDVCSHCGAGPIRQCVTAPVFRLAGSGWYETDFKKEGRRNLASGDRAEPTAAASSAQSEGKPEGKSEGKTESNPKSKPESKTKSASDTGT